MLELYGPEWPLTLASADEEATVGTTASSQPLRPGSAPAEGAGAYSPRPATREPGSGLDAARTGAPGPGSGLASPAPSWSSQSPGTPVTLGREVIKEFVPGGETLERFQNRIARQAQALSVLGEPLGEGVLEVLLARANYQHQLYSEVPDDPAKQLRILKRNFAFELLDMDGSPEQAGRLGALESMLQSQGVDTTDLRSMVALGVDVAPTPIRGAASSSGFPQSHGPSAQPAVPAIPHFPIHGTGVRTPVTHRPPVDPVMDAEMTEMRERLRRQEVELAATKLLAGQPPTPPPAPAGMLELMESQQKLLQAVIDKPKEHRSTIKVEPKVWWPKLGDDGPGGKEVEDFYEKFEDICSLANNGTGMADKEMLVALKSCLHGSRRQIYDNVAKASKDLLETDEGPGKTYFAIKKRLFRFLETPTEKQLRVSNEWTALNKTKAMTALQFEASWEQVHADLEEVGLGKPPLEKFLAYIVKVGAPINETIRMDRRPRKDGSGGYTTRLPETWEECHEVLCEIEGVKAGSRAFQTAARAAGQSPQGTGGGDGSYNNQGTFGPGGGKPKGKGKGKYDAKGGGKGDGGKGKGPKPVCFEMRDKGTCSR